MKKKIGIMSMQRIVNYGSFLQAFGLKSILEEFGYNVEFVDYKFETVIAKPKEKSFIKKALSNINIIKFLKKRQVLNEFKNKYNNEYLKILGVSNKNYNPDIDLLIIGSDEVFNCMQDYPVGYSKELFGKNYEHIDVISYAASFGHTTLNMLKKYNISNEVGSMLKKFKDVSVRDENSLEIVKNLTDKTPIMNLDPVLVASFDKFITNNVNLKDYIVVYAYPLRLTKKEEKYIKKFAKKENKKIVCLGMYQKIADYNLVVSPFEVLEYIKKADYVISDTFHGTIFSIINHTKFCTIIRNSNNNKLSYLLDKLKLKSRVANNVYDIEKLYFKEIDYRDTDKIIAEEKKNTIEYLLKNIK